MSQSHSSGRRVVITGLGIVSPLGIGAERFWDALAAGRSGIGPVGLLAASAAPHNVGGEVGEFDEQAARKTYLKEHRKSIKVMCREIQLGVASATLAFEQGGLDLDGVNRERFGVEFGANLMFSPPEVLRDACWNCVDEAEGRRFAYRQWGGRGIESMEPLWLLRYLPNMPACHIGIAADARGPSNSITLDEASGNLAVGEAARVIQRDRADVMLAGTTGTRLHAVKAIHAALWDELAESSGPPESWCRPFDRDRTGQVLGEGACSLLLEEESHALARGATLYGTVLGLGTSCVMGRDGTPGTRQALVNAMRAALRDAGLQPADIGHLNAHGLGETQMDRDEAAAIGTVFGDASVPVTALKSYFGNAGASCGTLELAGSLLGLHHGTIPTTLNYATPDPACPLNVIHGESLPVANRILMNVNVTRAGQASVLIVQG